VSNTGHPAGAPSYIEGAYGDLLIQPRPGLPPQLTLSVMDAEKLARLQSNKRDYVSVLNDVSSTDIVLAAINMAQASAMVLNVNAFMAAMNSVMSHLNKRQLIIMKDLLEEIGITAPATELEAILASCRR